MSPDALPLYAGLAALYAATGTLGLLLLLRALGRRPSRAGVLALLLALLFVALAFHPLPDRATMACPQGGAAPRLVPLETLRYGLEVWRTFPTAMAFVREWSVVVALANLLLCLAIGLAAAGLPLRPRAAAAAGAALAVGVELSQLTALWGLYPCPWRTFDVDDLLLNGLGLALGFALGRRRARAVP